MNNDDKASVDSERSNRTHNEDADTSHKRLTFVSRLPILNSNPHRHNISLDSGTSVSNNIPEVDDQLLSDENLSIEDINVTTATKDCTIIVANHTKTKSALDAMDGTTESTHATKESANPKNISKAAMLRQLFFSQINQINNATSDSQNTGSTDKADLDGVDTNRK